ncbi:MAG: damage-inducible protein, partial [Polyangiaceae bacterium]|nr:damage-inducible protein [Polyangiaceae bacterium]
SRISWTGQLLENARRGNPVQFEPTKLAIALYRPFTKQRLYFGEKVIHRPRHINALFPTVNAHNLVICTNSAGDSQDFCCLITNCIADLHIIGSAQCFPLYYYDAAEQNELLFDNHTNAIPKHTRKDGITDFILNKTRDQFGVNLTKEDIFFYVYGLLHSPQYRATFADDLKKSLPRIPLVEIADDFWAFSQAGRNLAHLHLDYEQIAPLPGVTVKGLSACELEIGRAAAYANDVTAAAAAPVAYFGSPSDAARLRVSKMKFLRKDRKDTILYNSHITIENIPPEAYEYVVSGRSAIEWIIDRYQIRTDKDSGIVNDPNLYGEELQQPYYILNLLLSVIAVSVRTQEIVRGLPQLAF